MGQFEWESSNLHIAYPFVQPGVPGVNSAFADATVIDITCACDWKMNSGGTGDHMFRLYNNTTSTVIWESYALKAAAGDGGSFSKTYQAALSASFAYVFKFQVKVSVATTFDKVKNRSITGVILKR